MAFPLYLAMTAPELERAPAAVPEIAWMACHFSPYSAGLSNFPQNLPENALLILNDCSPIHGHDPQQICGELLTCLEAWNLRGIVLDFQRPKNQEVLTLTQILLQALPCPVLVSDQYAQDFSCPVFLSAPPLYMPLADYLRPWRKREIWLEAALDSQVLSLTKEGCKIHWIPFDEDAKGNWEENTLHCTYKIDTYADGIDFTLLRDDTHLRSLLKDAESLGVQGAIGLYQQLGKHIKQNISG